MSKQERLAVDDAGALPVGVGPDGPHDPLLAALLLVASHHGRPVSPGAVTTGLPLVEGRLTANLLPRAAERAGLESDAVSRPLLEIPNLVLPAIIVLVDSLAVLQSLDQERGVG